MSNRFLRKKFKNMPKVLTEPPMLTAFKAEAKQLEMRKGPLTPVEYGKLYQEFKELYKESYALH